MNRDQKKKKQDGAMHAPMGRAEAHEMIVIQGGRQVTVYGCRKILHYAKEEIRLQLCGCTLCICGECLFCRTFCGGTVTVEGYVRQVSYEGIGAESRTEEGSGRGC